ncbi:hypothetical protein R1sor_022021 [Riccia sorocarpa]|uniref:Ubiquitin-like protease family profile domain-containing protein n=1 Tax=Riccia sorocarpa TaxID=122646 RepID=A0ABD3GIM8_9MARC
MGLEFPHRGDVINWYINRRWLSKTREELAGIYFVNTFWFPSLIGLMSSIQSSTTLAHNPFLRLRRGVSPTIHDIKTVKYLFVPIHFGKDDLHWSLAMICRFGGDCYVCHFDSLPGSHKLDKIMRALTHWVSEAFHVDPDKCHSKSFPTTRQKSGYECGYHVMQLISDLAGKLERLDLYFAQKGRSSDLALPMDDIVLMFELMLKMCLDPKEKRDFYPI